MGCVGSDSKVQLSQDDLESILAIDPQDWSQAQVIKWLQLTHDGDLRDLVEPFKAQKISGVTFVKLSEENLKNDLEIKQFGLRDGFISARNKLLERRNKDKQIQSANTITITTQNTLSRSNQSDDLKKHNSTSTKSITEKDHTIDISKGGRLSTQNNDNTSKIIEKQRTDQSEKSTVSKPTINNMNNMNNNNNNSNTTDQTVPFIHSSPNPMSSPNITNTSNKLEESMTNHTENNNSNQYQHKQPSMHQTTLSNNHLITKPNNVRHNQSFDDSGGVPVNIQQNAMNGGGNTGYEEIPDSFSPTSIQNATMNNPINNINMNQISRANGTFHNMPTDAFQHETPQEEDHYARIDFADLNHSDVPPSSSIRAPQMNGAAPLQLHAMNGGSIIPGQQALPSHGMNGMTMNGVNGVNGLYSMNSYQSNQIPFGMANGLGPSMTTLSNNNPHNHNINNNNNNSPNPPHSHNQTGSNYDELPLEFIDNIPNAPSPNPNNIEMNGNYPPSNGAPTNISGDNMGGYQEIEFNDHDDNLSSVPSNADSYRTGKRAPTIAKGSCVKVFDRNTNKWVEAEVVKVDPIQHNVDVRYLTAPHSHVMVPIRDIRTLLPPNHGSSTINDNGSSTNNDNNNGDNMNAAVQIQHVNPSGDHPPIMSSEEKQIHEFARDLWKTLHKIDVKTIADAHNEPIRGFSGKELVRHVKKHLKKHVDDLNDRDVIARCSDLVKYQYIRLIASAKTQNNTATDQDNNNNNNNNLDTEKVENATQQKIVDATTTNNNKTEDEEFACSEKYLYQFENEKHREFIKDDQPDRRAWTRGTKVEIYSSTLGGWQTGTVVEVNNDTLTITYGPPQQQMRKTLDRYQDDLVKSTTQFIENRKGWKKDSEIEVYSHGQHIWCQGRIEEVLSAKENQPVDIFRVFYTNNDDKDFSKYVDRWSPDLREVQQLSPKLAKYKKGTKVRVWSNSKQTWVPGVVIDVVPTYEVVNVRYGDHEKLVPVSSDDIKLLADDQ